MPSHLECNLPSGCYANAQVLELSLPDQCTAEYSVSGKKRSTYYGPITLYKDCVISFYCSNGESLTLSLSFCEKLPSVRGSLFIIGGADKCAEIHQKMLSSAGGVHKAKVAFIPSSSANPYASGMDRMARFKDLGGLYIDFSLVPKKESKLDFSSLGNNSSFWIVPVAIVDDEYTCYDPYDDPKSTITDESLFPDINEKNWGENGFCRKIAEKLRDDQYNLFFFSGGNQVRYIRSLVYPDGSDGPLLGMIRYLFEYHGAVIGGTSAGGAVLSKTMISGGSSAGAWLQGHIFESLSDEINSPEELPLNRDDDFRLVLGQGLGFLPDCALSDTHFIVRGRAGRLMKACEVMKNTIKKDIIGIGVGENSAVEIKDDSILAIGERGAIIIESKTKSSENEFLVHYLEQADKMYFHIDENGIHTTSFESNRTTCTPYMPISNKPEIDIFGRNKFRDLIINHSFINQNNPVFGFCLNDGLSDSYDEIPRREIENGWTQIFVINSSHAKCFRGEILTHWFGINDRDYPEIHPLQKSESYSFTNVQVLTLKTPVKNCPNMRDAYRVPNTESKFDDNWLHEFNREKQIRLGALLMRDNYRLLIYTFFYEFAYNDFDVVQTHNAIDFDVFIDNIKIAHTNQSGHCDCNLPKNASSIYIRNIDNQKLELRVNLNFEKSLLVFSD